MNTPIQRKPEEVEFQRKSEFLINLQTEVLEAEVALSTLSAELRAFEHRYLHIVGPQIARLDELRLRMIELVYDFSDNSPDIENQVRGYRDQATKSKAAAEEFAQKKEINPFTGSEDLKSFFREVAKKIHPDFATNEKDRSIRSELMKKANEAYSRGDMQALQSLLREWNYSPESIEEEGIGAELVRLIRKIARLEGRQKEICDEIELLRTTDLYRLMKKAEEASYSGIDMVQEIAEKMKDEVRTLISTLQNIIDEYFKV